MRRTVLLLIAALAVALPARASGQDVVPFACDGGGGAIAAMENSYAVSMGGPCWAHLGHHTYDAGAVYKVGAVQGRVFTVEVQFSPPTDVRIQPPGPLPVPPLPLPGAPVYAFLIVEGSVSGRDWDQLGEIPYRLTGGTRQEIAFAFDARGALARFLRIRQPRSAAQGLSGYLDSSSFEAELTPMPPGLIAPALGSKSYTCAEDAMERFFADHPCWFGGINRYDAPSVFHTYRVGYPAALTALRGSATFAPWRSDDYDDRGGSTTSLAFDVQVSVDGVTWTTLATFAGGYGEAIAFDLAGLNDVPATFVRFVAEPHAGYDQHPALKHARGMLIDSSFTAEAPALL